MTPKATHKTIYQLKITLRDIRPPIWRRVQVESSTTLSQLHLIVQAAMGWYNCHLRLINGWQGLKDLHSRISKTNNLTIFGEQKAEKNI
ncbi:MAG: plasmid pRiA4b ORF-3 family protein [Xenococcaceae cyanobacterium MO_234.B1]|nr:plasmid pRiA4b ORF-3 family protein [Xenococcaceae cyanobacterium MO_234.B1]